MNINRKNVATLFVSISLIASLLFVNYNAMSASPVEPTGITPTTRHLHKEEPLIPIHLHKEEPLIPVHLHPTGAFNPRDPLYSIWHEIHPNFCNKYNLTSWEDTDDSGNLTASDQIDLTNLETGEVTWYHLDRVTWTIFIEETGPPPFFEPIPVPPLYAELETLPKTNPPPITPPMCTDWHVVDPPKEYSRRFHIDSWEDTGEPFGEFSPCDHIDVYYYDEEPGVIHWYHVTELTLDLILTKKCFYDPVSTEWHELSPNFCQYYHIDSWEDTDGDEKLSSSDQIGLHVDWPEFHHDPALSGYSISTAPNTNTTLWKYNTTAPVCSSPAIVDNILYVGSLNNNTYALDSTTGSLIWTFTTGGPIWSSPAVAYGKVYILSCDGSFYALDAATGALIWSVFIDNGPWPWSSPAVHAGRVFIGASNGWIHCLNAFNGAIIWSTFIGGNPNSPIAVANNKVFSGTHNFNPSNHTLVALDELTGTIVWTYNYTLSVPGVTGMVDMNGAAVVDGDGDGDLEVYFGICTYNATTGLATGPGEAIALDESNGIEIWRYSFLNFTGVGGWGPGWSTSTPAVHGGKVFIGSDDQNVYALNAATGAMIWSYTTGAAVWASPAVADGKVFVGSLDHILYALNENTGALIWSYNTSRSRMYGSPAVACGKVFVGSQNGNVIAFGPRESKVRWHHVDRVTLTLLLKEKYEEPPMQLYAEFMGPFERYFDPIMNPVCTEWYIVPKSAWPPTLPMPWEFRGFHIASWEDNGDGVLSFCDQIDIYDIDSGEFLGWYHVEEVACDIIVNKKCFYDPIGSQWHELYPDFCTRYNLTSWEDTNGDGMLSPSDQIDITDKETGKVTWHHVDNVTLTIGLGEYMPEPWLYAEFMGPFEDFFKPKLEPNCTDWHVVYPPSEYSRRFHITHWVDNGDGVLSVCDEIVVEYWDEPGVPYWYHVEELACDIIITEKVVEVHDVAVINVFSRLPVVYQGDIDPIDVTVTNLGTFNESVTVYAFYDGNQAAPPQTTTLNTGETKTLTFMWNTTGVSPGFYTVSANATIAQDDDLSNNYLSGNVQEVRERPPCTWYVWDQPYVEVQGTQDFLPGWPGWWVRHGSTGVAFTFTNLNASKIVSEYVDVEFNLLITNRLNGEAGLDGLLDVSINPDIENYTITNVLFDNLDPTNHIYDVASGLGTYGTKAHITVLKDFIHEGNLTIKLRRHTDDPAINDPAPVCTNAPICLGTQDDPTPVIPPNVYENDDPHTVHIGVKTDATGTIAAPGVVVMRLQWLAEEGTGPTPEPLIHLHGDPLVPVHLHAEWLINLTEPICTYWEELYPVLGGHIYHLSSWEDNDDGFLSPSDQIDMTDIMTENVTWWHVDRVTVSLSLWNPDFGSMIIDYEGNVDPTYSVIRSPVSTLWHEILPTYCNRYHLLNWSDSGEPYGELSYCDYILLEDKDTGLVSEWHIDGIATDITLNQKITDPVCTYWHELYPQWCNWYHLSSWEDTNHDGFLNPCDQIDMTLMPKGPIEWYHVEEVTLTLFLEPEEIGEPMYIEYEGGFETMYRAKIEPVCTYWHEVYPNFSRRYHLSSWVDNGDGVLSHCDIIDLTDETTGEVSYWHVIEVSIDIIVKKKPTCYEYVWDQPYVEVQGTHDFIPGWPGWWVRLDSTGVAFTFTNINPSKIVSEYLDITFNLAITNRMNGEEGLDGLLDVVINPDIENYEVTDVLFDNLDPTNHIYYMGSGNGTYETKAHVTVHKSFIHEGNLTIKVLRHTDTNSAPVAPVCTEAPICLGTQENRTLIIPEGVYEDDDPHTVHIGVRTDANGTIAAPGEVVMRPEWMAKPVAKTGDFDGDGDIDIDDIRYFCEAYIKYWTPPPGKKDWKPPAGPDPDQFNCDFDNDCDIDIDDIRTFCDAYINYWMTGDP